MAFRPIGNTTPKDKRIPLDESFMFQPGSRHMQDWRLRWKLMWGGDDQPRGKVELEEKEVLGPSIPSPRLL